MPKKVRTAKTVKEVTEAYSRTGSVHQAAQEAGISDTLARSIIEESPSDEGSEYEATIGSITAKILKKVNSVLESDEVRPVTWKDVISALELVTKLREGGEFTSEDLEELEEALSKWEK